MSTYETCPWCGHAEYHKVNACEDTCCEGCPGVGDLDCDCQRTIGEIAFRNSGGWCYHVLGQPEFCAEHKALFPSSPGFFGEVRYNDRCEKWLNGPARWRFKDGVLIHK